MMQLKVILLLSLLCFCFSRATAQAITSESGFKHYAEQSSGDLDYIEGVWFWEVNMRGVGLVTTDKIVIWKDHKGINRYLTYNLESEEDFLILTKSADGRSYYTDGPPRNEYVLQRDSTLSFSTDKGLRMKLTKIYPSQQDIRKLKQNGN